MSKFQILNLVFFTILSYFTFYSLYGNRGYFAYVRYKQYYNEIYHKLNYLRSERISLVNDLNLLNSESQELDLLEEYSKKILGFVANDEVFFNVHNTQK